MPFVELNSTMQTTAIDSILDRVIESLGAAAEAKNIVIEAVVDPGVGSIRVDVYRNGKTTFSASYHGHAVVSLGTAALLQLQIVGPLGCDLTREVACRSDPPEDLEPGGGLGTGEVVRAEAGREQGDNGCDGE